MRPGKRFESRQPDNQAGATVTHISFRTYTTILATTARIQPRQEKKSSTLKQIVYREQNQTTNGAGVPNTVENARPGKVLHIGAGCAFSGIVGTAKKYASVKKEKKKR